jgi:hypothetical protein
VARHEFLDLAHTLAEPLLMRQQHRHHHRLKRPKT